MNVFSRIAFAAAVAAPLAFTAVAAKAADIVDTAVSAGQASNGVIHVIDTVVLPQ
ncbi:MAG: hypothetical protein ACM35H_04740 [Bacteroidota bacterium]|nr:hypothetical protein [Kiloniellaceae bacterium]